MISTILSKIRHPLVTNSFYLYMAHFADYLLLLFILPFIARALGPVALGNIGLAQAIGLLVMVGLEFGFSITATRKVASNRNDKLKNQQLAGKVFSFKIYLIPVVILFTFVIILIHPIFFNQPELIIISILTAICQSFIPSWYFQGIQNFKQLAIVKIIFRVLAFFTALMIVRTPSDDWLFLMIQAFSSFFIAVVLLLLMIKNIGPIKFQRWREIRTILKSSSSGFFIIILPTLFNNISIFLLSYLISPLLLGYYYGVSRIHRAFNTLYSPMFESFFPYLVKTYQNDHRKAYNKTIIFNFFISALGCFFSLIIWVFSETIISILLGEAFIPSADYLRAFGFLLPITVIAYIWGNQWMIVLKEEKILSNILLISNSIGIVCLILTISKLEIFAIPFSIALSELIKLFLIMKSIKH